jgi:hypothetical protein
MILIACEFSGIVRDAFRARGHHAWSCDLLPTEIPSPFHIQGDVRDHLDDGWDMMIAFPPCTYLTRAGYRWHNNTPRQRDALNFVRELMDAPIRRIAIENPRGAISRIRPPDMVLQPWQYGHQETKATGLWLQNLPPLMVAAHVGGPYEARVHRAAPGPERWRERSRTLPGVAEAMAEQWGNL